MEQDKKNLNDFETSNLSPEKQVPGGPAVNPKPAPASPETVGDSGPFDDQSFGQKYPLLARQKSRSKAQEIAESARSSAKEAIKKAVADKTRVAIIQAARSAAIAAWASLSAAIGPYAAVIVIALILLLFICVPAIAIVMKARNGFWGIGAADGYSSVASASDMASIREVLNNSLTVRSPETWYFNQGDSNWGGKSGQVSGWKDCGSTYKDCGCTITSAAMIAKYYGVKNADPYDLGGFIAQSGSMLLDRDLWLAYMYERADLNKKFVGVDKSIEAVTKEIQAGNPIIAQGNTAFRAGGQHWVVIVGVSKDQKNLVISDPSADESRGRAARYSPAEELINGKIIALGALHDK